MLLRKIFQGWTACAVRCSPAVQLHHQLAAAVVVHKLKLADVPYRRQNALVTVGPAC